ncbi:Folylpolyglutamate synthase, mitochondrial [Operophtera brumata]|uniref:tetrahydrofolate synthase n=1 Tax=Operophtera brumata TaxID=104452 RepID=A0A0L7LCE2_OPEBR|nr:Folylpolyglutamate synthase, mitochondrial [Operophtera brumata]
MQHHDANDINSQRMPPSSKKCTNIEDMENYLARTGVPLTKLDELSVIHVAGTKGKVRTLVGITALGLDHTSILGHTLPETAAAKAGVMKPGCAAYSVRQPADAMQVLRQTADAVKVVVGITALGLDHTSILGHTLPETAAAKAGVMKPGCAAYSVRQPADAMQVLRQTADAVKVVVGITALGLDHTFILGHTLPETAAAKAGVMKPGCAAYTVRQPADAMQVLRQTADAVKGPGNVPVVGITALGLDHTFILGHTLPETAAAKAGVMKPGCAAYTVRQPADAMRVLRQTADAVKVGSLDLGMSQWSCSLTIAPDYNTYTFPESQKPNLQVNLEAYRTNASLAIQLAHSWLRTTQGNLKKNGFKNDVAYGHNGLKNGVNLGQIQYEVPLETMEGLKLCIWPGRYQVVQREYATFFLDGAHTKESMEICAQWFTDSNSR